jgi:hypothetical protein
MPGSRHAALGAVDHAHGTKQALDTRRGGGAGGWGRQVRSPAIMWLFPAGTCTFRLCPHGHRTGPQTCKPGRSGALGEPDCPAAPVALPLSCHFHYYIRYVNVCVTIFRQL